MHKCEEKIMIKNRVIKNASWIIGCKIVQSALNLFVTMFTARYLGPSNYGLISYAASVVAFFIPIMQLGLTNILVREYINYPDEEGKITGTALVMSGLSSIFTVISVIAFALVANFNEPETIIVCTLYSISLVTQALEIIQYWFQAKLLSKYTAVVSLFSYVIISSYKIFLLVSRKSIYWFAVSYALDYLIISMALIILYHNLGGMKLSVNKSTAHRMWNQGKHYILSSLMVTIFTQTDRVMIKLMVDDASTGYYSAAVTCAGLANFVYMAIIDSARPSIFESKLSNQKAFEKNIVRLYSIVIWASILQCVAISLFSPFIINILYGRSYVEAIGVLRVVTWYVTFSFLGSVRNIWILAEEKQKYLWIINLSGALANIVLNFLLIPIWGMMGAAIASLITQFFANVIIGFILKPIMYNNFLMFKSFNPKYIFELIKRR